MSAPELLLTVPSIELHQVQHQQDQLLLRDSLSLLLDQANNPQASSVIARVGNITWNLQKSVPCLKSEDRTYIFSLPDRIGIFYCVIVAPETPSFVIESFEGVLRSSCDFSTMEEPSPAGTKARTPHSAPHVADGVPVPPAQAQAASTGSQPSNMTKQVSGGLVKGAGLASQGLVGLAGFAATGIQKLADLTLKNTKPSPTGTMAPETRAKLDRASAAINQAGSVLAKFASNTYAVAGTAAAPVTRSINTNRSVQKFQAHPDVQTLGTASRNAGAQLFAGMRDAANIIAASTQSAVQQYKAKKYPGEVSAATSPMNAYTADPTNLGLGQPSQNGGYPAGGNHATAYPSGGYPSGAHPSGGYPSGGYPSAGYPDAGYPSGGSTHALPGNIPPAGSDLSGPPGGYPHHPSTAGPSPFAAQAGVSPPAGAHGYPTVPHPNLYPPEVTHHQ